MIISAWIQKTIQIQKLYLTQHSFYKKDLHINYLHHFDGWNGDQIVKNILKAAHGIDLKYQQT